MGGGGGGGKGGLGGLWGDHMVFQENGEGISRHQQSTKELVKEIDARLPVRPDPSLPRFFSVTQLKPPALFHVTRLKPPALFQCDPTQTSRAFSM